MEGILSNSAKIVLNYGLLGVVTVISAIAIYFLVRYIKIQHKVENERLSKEKEDSEGKVDVLYKEIFSMKTEQIEKYVTMQNQSNEIHKQTVEALKNNTQILRQNSEIFNKLIEKI